MSARTVPEWVGATPDAAIPTRVKLRIFERCNGRCALTGVKLGPATPFDYDHIKPLILGGEHRELNLQVVCRDAHRIKSAEDQGRQAKADRVRLKHLGIYPKSPHRIASRGFGKRGVEG